jgi:cytochrome c553
MQAALLAALLVLAALPACAGVPDDPADSGKRIYLDGLLPSGEPLRGKLQNGTVLSGSAAACAVCHRRSGLGGGEGQNNVRPIAGRLLFISAPAQPSPYGVVEIRPAYTLDTLARALRDGVDPAGRELDALMPRYELAEEELRQLAAYLQLLAPVTEPGVTGSEIHFATIIAADAAPAQQKAMLDVLQAFFAVKNGGTRQEQRRREVGRNVTGEQMYRGYRSWQLHSWRLDGPADSWPAQLEKYYREQPVFAVLSGIAAASWQPVHEFCERNGIPCLFPNTSLPVTAGNAYSSFYFSRGLALEAEVLAKHLAADGEGGGNNNIVQVFRDDAGGRVPAQALRAALRQRGIDTVVDRPLSGSGPVSESYWRELLSKERPNTLVLWLNDADIASFPLHRQAPTGLDGLYVSASMVARPDRLQQAEGWLDRVRIVDQLEPATQRAQRMTRMHAWLRARNVPPADEHIQANTFFAASIAGDALAHMDENFSRDYFIERVEHMTEQSLFHSVYPRLSLGPGQRFASKGGYVTGVAQDGAHSGEVAGDWIVP